MSKTSRKNRSGRDETLAPPPVATVLNLALLALALVGMALTAYLTFTYWRGQALAGCPAGSGCDIVLNSRWSKLFGLPTSFWGFLVYAGLAAVALVKKAETQWKSAWLLSFFGVLYSLYLSSVSLLELNAACLYCLVSATLFVGILATVAYQRPADLPNFSWRPWLFKTAGSGLILVLALHLHYAGILGKAAGPEEPRLRALAEHLTKTDAKFYGAYWCPHCNEQKEMFGASAGRLPYIECSPLGPKQPQDPICRTANIKVYPTWFINGRRHEGVLTPGELAHQSGFKEAAP
ncbi:MAG: hypothetical protein A3F90_02165 [Deltaproteobacteria bacterium RIFCSPLOWO2_12_FULL_60_19]|nr:MAG: hypothetical protein A3F90_02165 [Deltaproteobacteria bacterium RIFCSPLOWO2_12_FULL_60_19]